MICSSEIIPGRGCARALLLGSHQGCIILPAHILHEILGTGDERGAVVAYQVVAAFAVVVALSCPGR